MGGGGQSVAGPSITAMRSCTGGAQNTLSTDFQFSSAAANTSGQLVEISTVNPSGWKTALRGRLKSHPIGSGRAPNVAAEHASSEKSPVPITSLSAVESAIPCFFPSLVASTTGRAANQHLPPRQSPAFPRLTQPFRASFLRARRAAKVEAPSNISACGTYKEQAHRRQAR